ncbi:hypothetical protein R3X27_06525 [Tropicimonas sp. TH_r6]|uniref:hypothetical protein n=1 Tax=Tropicimonas sp. TH_r6 TaxID=3082085 RepID=UPI00295503AE|nr:hypothetical protein [Tropicimonas sp. TH_r6]MDV7142332.1 hypothetical protein [Tropicimonas sp. TH_r6]
MESKPYIFVYSDDLGTRDELVGFLNDQDEIDAWRYDMDYCFYLLSSLSAVELSKRVKAALGTEKRFLISEVGSNRQGWLSKGSWGILNKNAPEKLERADVQISRENFSSISKRYQELAASIYSTRLREGENIFLNKRATEARSASSGIDLMVKNVGGRVVIVPSKTDAKEAKSKAKPRLPRKGLSSIREKK